jgi:hypothetical protein
MQVKKATNHRRKQTMYEFLPSDGNQHFGEIEYDQNFFNDKNENNQ